MILPTADDTRAVYHGSLCLSNRQAISCFASGVGNAYGKHCTSVGWLPFKSPNPLAILAALLERAERKEKRAGGIMKFISRLRLATFFVIVVLVMPLAVSVASADTAAARLVVNTAFLNIRSGPGVSYPVIATASGGDTFPVTMISRNGGWYQVDTSAGSGWVNVSYTLPRGYFAQIRVKECHDQRRSGTNPLWRAACRGQHSISQCAHGTGFWLSGHDNREGGTELLVTAINRDSGWYQVETAVGSGWLNPRYTVTRGNFASVRAMRAPVAPPVSAGQPHLVVNTAYQNVRSGPGLEYGAITTVPGGTELPVTGIAPGGVWYRVETLAGSGWANVSLTAPRGNFTQVPQAHVNPATATSSSRVVINTAFLNVRRGPGLQYDIIRNLPGGTTLPVLGITRNGSWFQVQTDLEPAGCAATMSSSAGIIGTVPIVD